MSIKITELNRYFNPGFGGIKILTEVKAIVDSEMKVLSAEEWRELLSTPGAMYRYKGGEFEEVKNRISGMASNAL